MLDYGASEWRGGVVAVDKEANEVRVSGLAVPPPGTILFMR
ncbi:MAG: hypothetical protein ACOX5G_00590 [Kiritimatiellia bacterium]